MGAIIGQSSIIIISRTYEENIYPLHTYSVEQQTRKNSNFPVRGIFKNPREIIVNIFR
jgi:hypothetical protein